MSEPDVARTLKEIREKVRVQLRTHATVSPIQNGQPRNTAPENAFESLRANLAVIERSRNKLPPVLSYRKGWVARLELSIKRLLKRITHWFTWEQVNFNAATFNALQEILVVLSAHKEVLSELQVQIEKLAAPTENNDKAEVDVEIEKLAARLEALRAARAKMSS